MDIMDVMAAVAVSDLDRAEGFYTDLIGARPSERPMGGLIEWHLGAAGVLQVTVDADRAGGSLVTLVVDALDDPDGDTSAGGAFRALRDPDGNGVTLLTR